MIERAHIGRAVQMVATDPFEFFLAGALMGGLMIATAGLLVGPSACGVIAIALKRCRGEEIDIMDAFQGFDNFAGTFLVGLALTGMVLFGSIFLIIPGLVLAALFSFALPIAVDRRVLAGEAFKQARILASRDFFARLIFTAVLGVIALSGAVFLIIGMCVTVPLALTALTIAYHDAAYPEGVAAEAPAGGRERRIRRH
jgi:uncharacterized membrane protein